MGRRWDLAGLRRCLVASPKRCIVGQKAGASSRLPKNVLHFISGLGSGEVVAGPRDANATGAQEA